VRPDHSAAFAASRGEYLCALIVSELLDCAFVDATELIHFDEHGSLATERTRGAIAARLANVDRAVIPGFYGRMPDGTVQTFSRGGSDVSGALVAQGVGADVYENWTDVSGLLMTDPRIVENPKTIDVLTYRELRELAYMGATVVHEDAIFPVHAAAIRVNIRNTNAPDAPGTVIVPEAAPITHLGTISGIAGRRDFTVIAVEKALMNSEIGFGRRLLGVLEAHGISYEHTPSGIDTMSVVIADAELKGKLDVVIKEIRQVCGTDMVEAFPNMALIATVGRGMAHTPGIAAKLFTALGAAAINIRMIDQGSSELNIIVGVEAADFERAVRTIYDAFVK
jgi:aspartate kinase